MDVMKKYHLHILPKIIQNEEDAKYVLESILLICMGSISHQRGLMETHPALMMTKQ